MCFIAHYSQERKKEQFLHEHLNNVSNFASYFSSKISCPEIGKLLGLLHDLGKYSTAFQNYIKSATDLLEQKEFKVDHEKLKGKIDHSTSGAQLIWEYAVNSDDNKKLKLIFAQFLALCVASHHGGLIDCITPDGRDEFSRRIKKNYEQTFLQEVKTNADKEILDTINKLIKSEKAYNEFLSIFKRIVQDKNKTELIKKFHAELFLKFNYSCLIDADRTDTIDFENPDNKIIRQNEKYIEWDVLIDRFENKIKDFEKKTNKNPIDNIRARISNTCKEKADNEQGIFSLTVPTGGGKTLASLRFALYHARKYQLERIIYVIPFTSIIDQNAQIVRDILETEPHEKGTIVLEHHSNLLPANENEKTKILKENWDAPIIFTTMVQFLETVFGSGTRHIRRFHQMAKSILIFDEVQTLPIKTVHLFNNTINFLVENCSTTVVLCTATQPLLNNVNEQKGKLILSPKNEIIDNVEELFQNLKRVDIIDETKISGWNIDEISEFAIKQTKNEKNCLIIANTKKNAINLYQAITKKINSIPVFHLSTSMCPEHRIQTLNKIKNLLNNNEECICISTQLIEAGVDVDFGCVIRFLAGIDSIAQAAGRCNRNGKRNNSKVFIVNPIEEKIDSLIEIKVGKEITSRILNEIKNTDPNLPKNLLDPKLLERYFKYYFYDRANMMDYPVNTEREDNLLNMLSENTLAVEEYKRINDNNVPNIYFRQSFKTASEHFKVIDAPTLGIIVPYESDGKEIITELFNQFAYEKRSKLLKRAQRYTVNVYDQLLQQLIKQNAIRQVPEIEVYVLTDSRFYHPAFGLSENPIQEYELLIQ